MSKKIVELQRQNHYDAISCQDAISGVCCFRLRKEFSNLPITITMHTYFGIECTLDGGVSKNSKLYKKICAFEESCLEFADNVVAVDERIKEHIADFIKKDNYKIKLHSIKNFTNTDIFKSDPSKVCKIDIRKKYLLSESDFVGICVRRLVEKNGVFYAVQAFKYIENLNIKLLVLGNGPEFERINTFIKKNKLDNRVILVGEIPNDQVLCFYQASDYAVVPSITVNGLQEATSISAIEAMSCKLPTIASDIGGLKEMITNDVNGVLITEQSSEEIAEAIENLYNNNARYDRLANASREYVINNYSYLDAAKEYWGVFINEK